LLRLIAIIAAAQLDDDRAAAELKSVSVEKQTEELALRSVLSKRISGILPTLQVLR